MSKFQAFVLITAAFFLILFWTASAQVPCHSSTPGGPINVFTPGAGTYSNTSYQAVNWSTNGPLRSDQKVEICITKKRDSPCDILCYRAISSSVPFGYGTSPTFEMDLGPGVFYSLVQSKDDPTIWGAGPPFSVTS
ncbi:4061_t:CDS:2 [Ambispora leptoticha]|uniref:4061_t:CDS:1 n=1 Tax=Ambispora leptoticha TaxID=144679 RepID=A0A9N8WAX0_9GLOM|nr:4061_t:CDS:2 [Ambispora leptoticha]